VQVPVDHVTYGSLANAFAKSGQWEAAVKVLEEMRARPSLRPNNFVYCSVMSACNRSNQWTVALALLDQLLKKVRMCADHQKRKGVRQLLTDLVCG
jgi:pentatricopeptide repeat protein